MIDEIRNPGSSNAGGPPPVRRNKDTAPAGGASPSGGAAAGRTYLPEFRNRLAGVAGQLDTLLEDLSRTQSQARSSSDLAAALKRLRDRVATGDGDGARALSQEITSLGNDSGLIDGPVHPTFQSIEQASEHLEGALDRIGQRRTELEHSISAAQIAIQNILSTGGEGELPPAPPEPPGHDLDRQNILQLLERE